MPCCGTSDPYAGIRALSQSQRHGRKPWRGFKVVVLLLHVPFIGAVFLLDPTLQRRIHEAKWCMILYGVLVLLSLVQYLYTDNSSPGYVADMLRAGSGMHATFINIATLSKKDRSVQKNGSLNSAMSRSKIEQQNPQSTASSSFVPVMDLHPLGSSSRELTCSYCRLIQPPRTKHCHDCDKCVLQFDHHCVWLGTCISKRNHCRFWWKGFIGSILLVALILILIVLLLLLMFHT